jgi:hypothetical protein
VCCVPVFGIQLYDGDLFLLSPVLHSGVSVGNRIGAEGAKALCDALKDNATLTSLSLNLSGEQSWFRW